MTPQLTAATVDRHTRYGATRLSWIGIGLGVNSAFWGLLCDMIGL